MKTKTLIEKQLKRKNNPELATTIILAKKNTTAWNEVASILSSSRENRINLNLDEISRKTLEGENIVVSGKVLSQGNIDKKFKISALSFSERAKEKLLKSGCKVSSILEEIKSNPSGKGIKILK
jgi:large subunit ribosomal protein L18e